MMINIPNDKAAFFESIDFISSSIVVSHLLMHSHILSLPVIQFLAIVAMFMYTFGFDLVVIIFDGSITDCETSKIKVITSIYTTIMISQE